ncbi:unnamed protein product [Medioppia subpectinata]|uniref:Uncharacterized protein n=1 Tax=Medioppia subpectinata TaxID=1979941 RepID=A0A7R9KCB3_9ACAR|nr:unnamed protein product [Medioppia subpectinata]CAG2100561.1 unnamed protein product [Medioppia subpectinata]
MVLSSVLADKSMNFDENPSGNNILEMLRGQRRDGRFCDIVLHVTSGSLAERRFPAHRSLLAACSQYFESVLKTHRVTKEQINIGCHDVDVFETLLDYMYSGNITIDWHNVNELLKLSNYFLMAKVNTYCHQFLEHYLSVDNCIAVRDLAQKYSLDTLVHTCNDFIADNSSEIIEQPFMSEMTAKKLESIIRDPTIGLASLPVSQLLTFFISWVKKDIDRRSAELEHFLALIEWHKMKLEFIYDHIDTEVLYRENRFSLYVALKSLHQNNINIDRYLDSYKEMSKLFAKNCRSLASDNETENELIVPDDEQDITPNSPIVVEPIDSEPNTKHKGKVQNQRQQSTRGSKKIIERKRKPMNRRKAENCNSSELTDNSLSSRNRKRNVKQRYPKNEWFVYSSVSKKKTNCGDSQSVKVLNNRSRHKKSSDREDENESNLDEAVDDEEELKSDENYSDSEDLNEGNDLSPKRRIKREDKDESSLSLGQWKDGVKCPHCIYVGHSATRLEQHLSRVHEEDTTYQCKMCPFVCKWNREFYKHMKSHFDGPPYKCEDCEYSCDRIQFILSHRMRHTDERPYNCELCPFKSRTKGNLIVHMRIHTGEKPYQCTHCHRAFAMKNTLDQHLATHREERPFLCDSCGFTTKYQSHLLSHKRIHTGNVFHCDQTGCTYSSPRRSQLAAHTRSHLSIRTHICSTCGRAFIEKSHLIRHERIHLDEKPFKCQQCEYGSTRRDKLKEHVLKHHTGDQTPKTAYKQRKPRRQTGQQFTYITETLEDNDNSIASQVAIVSSPQDIHVSQSQLSDQELCTATASLIYEYSSGEVTVSPARVVIQSTIPSVTYDSVDQSVVDRIVEHQRNSTNNANTSARVVIQSIPSTGYVSNNQTERNSSQNSSANNTAEMGVNYESGGLLLDILAKEGQQALIAVLKSKEFRNNMYQNGFGKEFDISNSSHILCNISENSDFKPMDNMVVQH